MSSTVRRAQVISKAHEALASAKNVRLRANKVISNHKYALKQKGGAAGVSQGKVVAKYASRPAKEVWASAADMVDHPKHYGGDVVYEPIKVMEDWEVRFALGINELSAIKYISRNRMKGNRSENLQKAIWHLQRELDKENV